MIVVIGAVHASGSGEVAPAGLAAGIALAAAAAARAVELVARIGDDPAGDAVLLAFAAAGIGHVATLRDPARRRPPVEADDEPMDRSTVDDDGAARRRRPGRADPRRRRRRPGPALPARLPGRGRGPPDARRPGRGRRGGRLGRRPSRRRLDPAMDDPTPVDLPADALVLAVDGTGDRPGRPRSAATPPRSTRADAAAAFAVDARRRWTPTPRAPASSRGRRRSARSAMPAGRAAPARPCGRR